MHLARLPGCPPRSEHGDGDGGKDVDDSDCEGCEGDGPNTDDDSTIVGLCAGTAEKWAESVQEVLSMPKLNGIFQEDCFSLPPPIPYPAPRA